ncbi:hypothetical protein N9M64_01820 [bacterium]|nr:hypothetical protein [bacterium]
MEQKDNANIGLSEDMHIKLREMTDNGVFSEMKDGYRLAASLAMAHNLEIIREPLKNRKNMYDVGGVDENFIFRNAIRVIYPEQLGQEYKYLEKLADAGVSLLFDNYDENGNLDLESILIYDA